jgi:hypothetical protein
MFKYLLFAVNLFILLDSSPEVIDVGGLAVGANKHLEHKEKG